LGATLALHINFNWAQKLHLFNTISRYQQTCDVCVLQNNQIGAHSLQESPTNILTAPL